MPNQLPLSLLPYQQIPQHATQDAGDSSELKSSGAQSSVLLDPARNFQDVHTSKEGGKLSRQPHEYQGSGNAVRAAYAISFGIDSARAFAYCAYLGLFYAVCSLFLLEDMAIWNRASTLIRLGGRIVNHVRTSGILFPQSKEFLFLHVVDPRQARTEVRHTAFYGCSCLMRISLFRKPDNHTRMLVVRQCLFRPRGFLSGREI